MDFEWDPKKATRNKSDHKVTFEEAATVFGDPLALTFSDPDHSEGEYRFLTFGCSNRGRLRTRIISARKMDATERKIYEGG
jgi:uncharacterized DUF497 family protein